LGGNPFFWGVKPPKALLKKGLPPFLVKKPFNPKTPKSLNWEEGIKRNLPLKRKGKDFLNQKCGKKKVNT